jgi:hypothetical protein
MKLRTRRRTVVGHSERQGACASEELGRDVNEVVMTDTEYSERQQRGDGFVRAYAVTIDAADPLTSQRHHLEFTRLQRMRRRRNDFMYDVASQPTQTDLDRARLDVSLLLSAAENALAAIR